MNFRPLHGAQETLRNIQDDMGRLMERVWHAGLVAGPFDGQEWAPQADLLERSDRFVLLFEVPGVDPEGIEVSHLAGALTIRGDKSPGYGPDEGARLVRGERRYGLFCRTLELPPGIDADKLSARCCNGVLEITLPKAAGQMPKAVKINVQDGGQ